VEHKQFMLSDYSILFSDMDQHYRTLVETLPGVVYALDERGHFAYLSQNVTDVLGYEPQELIGLHFSNIVHPDDLSSVSRDYILPKFSGISTGNERAPKLFDERRAPPRRTTDLRMRLFGKKNSNGDKHPIFCNVNASGQHTSSEIHNFQGTVGIIFDCVQDVEAIALIDKKRHYNPYELLSSAMRHTFSNLFTGIYGNLQLMEMQMAHGKDFKSSMEAIKTCVESAVEVLKQLANIGLASPMKKKVSNTEMILKEAAEELFVSRNISMDFKVGEIAKLDIDPDYARHIIRSILFLIRESVGNVGAITFSIANADAVPPDIPRLDCNYVKILVEIDQDAKEPHAGAFDSELDRVAAGSMGYVLLRKCGGLVKVISENAIALLLPSQS
jgi:PAS fold